MSFWDHLDALRGTLFRSALAVMVFSAFGLAFKNILFDGIILAPTRGDFVVYRTLGWAFDMQLINVDISAQFFVHLKIALAVGAIVAFPIIIFELWKFLAPALYDREKPAVRKAFGLASVLFYLGIFVGYYFVLPVCLSFFMNYSISDTIDNTITLSSYISMFLSLVLMIGIVFEFPAVIAVLSKIGIVYRSTLRAGRKYAVVVIMGVAALITPSDPFSMMVLAVPLYLLYEFSILLCKEHNEEDD